MEFFNVESPFSFDLGEDLVPLPSLPSSSVISPPLDNDGNRVSQKPKNGRRKKPLPNTCNDDGGDENLDEQKKKKIIHRDVERQRRQEMSSLYTTLRSLLPLEYLKGKRSISDHMQETVSYIQHMQRRIQQLKDKRDKLRELANQTMVIIGTTETLNSSERDSVVVRAKDGIGIQVVLDTATKHRLPLSIFVQALVAEGLEILNCISNRLNERFIHTIECQTILKDDGCYPTIDASMLQHKLANLEYYPLD
ncbi:transcription factor bHLH120-like protein [Cucumis melo var. makuwa]|uniref:Transcription factor bHLH120-like protein n=5 Tax=Cucumis melo TaxID=3656 RepID=A0A5A7TN30_CUCMM|nr:transcription factor bHLH118-like [Cucumis melo]KAA0042815.1 transcription factor bHLH120-like protein [Cucumis melo var. makuwa]